MIKELSLWAVFFPEFIIWLSMFRFQMTCLLWTFSEFWNVVESKVVEVGENHCPIIDFWIMRIPFHKGFVEFKVVVSRWESLLIIDFEWEFHFTKDWNSVRENRYNNLGHMCCFKGQEGASTTTFHLALSSSTKVWLYGAPQLKLVA